MSDIFHEVEEEVRKERLEKLWKQYGDYVIAVVSVIVLGVAGYKLWQAYEARQQIKASSEYVTAMKMVDTGRYDLAATGFNNIAKTAPSGYAEVAKLSEADSLMAAGKTAEAVALYNELMKDNKAGLAEVARIRSAWGQADTISRNDLETLLKPLTDANSPWRFMAREILAYRDFKDGKLADAQREYGSLMLQADANSALRQRARAMDTLITTLIHTGGNPNYGTVPPPPGATPAKPAQQGKAAQ